MTCGYLFVRAAISFGNQVSFCLMSRTPSVRTMEEVRRLQETHL
jgi:hypothetical protein